MLVVKYVAYELQQMTNYFFNVWTFDLCLCLPASTSTPEDDEGPRAGKSCGHAVTPACLARGSFCLFDRVLIVCVCVSGGWFKQPHLALANS